jgi:prophage regulatory protein
MIRISGVIAITKLGRSHIYKLVANGDFPKPRRLTPRTSAWIREEVESWASTRPFATNADLNMKPALDGKARQRHADVKHSRVAPLDTSKRRLFGRQE